MTVRRVPGRRGTPATVTARAGLLGGLLAGLLMCSTACAQWAGAVSVQSDYRYRGLSRSNGDPSARATLSYDDPGGWYAGASIASVELQPGRTGAEVLAYGGRAWRLDTGLAWDLGVTASHFTAARDADYGEVHAGLAGSGWNVRLHHAPDYYGTGARTLYAEANVARALRGPMRAFAHAGTLLRLDDTRAHERRSRADLRLGLAAAFEAWDVQLSWVTVQRERAGAYGPVRPPGGRSAVVLGATIAF